MICIIVDEKTEQDADLWVELWAVWQLFPGVGSASPATLSITSAVHSLSVGGDSSSSFFPHHHSSTSPPPLPRCHSLSNSTYRCFTSPPPPHSNHISATGLEFRFDSQTYANRQGLDTSWRWTRFLEKVQTAQWSRWAYKTPDMFFSVTFLFTWQGHGFTFGFICKSCAALTNCVFVLALWWE